VGPVQTVVLTWARKVGRGREPLTSAGCALGVRTPRVIFCPLW
jgi:hypothetical protein